MGRPITEGEQGGSLKVVTNSGDLDGTNLYYYGVPVGVRAGRSVAAGLRAGRVVQVRDGSENVMRQIVHGTRYIDEVVLEILEDGVVWVHQDANWNVIALTDFAGRVLEHYYQTPYGIMTVDQESYFGDSDGDGKVTEAEWDTDEDGQLDSDDDCWGSDPSGVCRLVDFDFDGDVDATDATRLAELDSSTTYRQPGQPSSGIGNTRAHHGLIYDAEIGSYNNRSREYTPQVKRFLQRDPLCVRPSGASGYDDGANLYGYTRGNPSRYKDPSGRGIIGKIKCVCTCITCWDVYTCVGGCNTDCSTGDGYDDCVSDCVEGGTDEGECVALFCHPPGGGAGPEGGEGYQDCRDSCLDECEAGTDLGKCAKCLKCAIGIFFPGFGSVPTG